MFRRGGIKSGDYVFVVQKEGNFSKIIIGRVQGVNGSRLNVIGTSIMPRGLIERVQAGRAGERPKQVLSNPDPNNCIFLLIDRVEAERFSGEIDQSISKAIWINENRFFVLDGWIRENLPDMFADVLTAATEEQRAQARASLLEKMNSLYEKDLKDHVYAVARSTKIL
jgi:hypothetical protein